MRLYVARHGQTQWNLEDKVCGSTDLPLTDLGLSQARELAKKAAQIRPDVIIASTMLRARQTAGAAAVLCGVEVLTDERIREQDFGEFEGAGRLDEQFRSVRVNFPYHFPGGESTLRLVQRVYNFLDDVKARFAGKTVLVVCHGSVSRVIRTYFENMTNEEYFRYLPGNGELVEYIME